MPAVVATLAGPSPIESKPIHEVKIEQLSLEKTPLNIPLSLDTGALETSTRILHVIDRYRLKRAEAVHNRSDESTLKFVSIIYTHVKAQEPVLMCLPAFPFKSPNSTRKVLGKLPDKSEELALSHLNGL